MPERNVNKNNNIKLLRARYDGESFPRGPLVVDAQSAMKAFLPHVRLHLGVSQFASVRGCDETRLDTWEVNRLARRVAVHSVHCASESLRGFVSLLERISTVGIDAEMAARVTSSLDHIDMVSGKVPAFAFLCEPRKLVIPNHFHHRHAPF